ncbi:MAG: hypothetical protein ACR2RV_27825 [Verrucomicrobiales bacterium]
MSKSSKTDAPSPGDLRDDLRRRNLKWNWDAIAADCVAHQDLLPQLLRSCTDSEVIIQQNAGAVLGKIIDLDQAILVPHLPEMLANLEAQPHDAVKRATMRVLQSCEIPEAQEGAVFDVAMRYVSDFEEAIAIRGYSITVARRLCQRYPSLRHELLPIVHDLIEQNASAAIVTRAKRELKLLEELTEPPEG